MAMSVGDLEAVIRLRDELSPAMRVAVANTLTATNQINASLASVGSSAQQSGTAMVAAGGIISNVVMDLASKFMNLSGRMIELAGKQQNLITVSRYLAGQNGVMAGEVDRLAGALNRQGISLNQSRDSIIQMTRANLDLAKAEKLGTVAQSAARLSGLNSSEVMGRLIFGIQTMQPEVLRTSGIIVNLEKAYSDMALTLGKSTSALSGAEKQQAAFNAVLKEGEKISGVYNETQKSVAGQQQSLQRYQDDALTKLGEGLIPAQLEWIRLQREFYKEIAKHPDMWLKIGAALAVVATYFGANFLGLGKLISGLSTAGMAMLSFASKMSVTTTATLAQAAADRSAAVAATQRAMAEAAASKIRNVGFGSFAGAAVQQDAHVLARAANAATPALASAGAAGGIGAAINSIGTAAGMAGGAVVGLTGFIAAMTVAALAFGAAIAGWKIGSLIKDFQLWGVSIGQWLDATIAMGSQGGAFSEKGRQAFRDTANMARMENEAAKRAATEMEAAAKRQAEMRAELEKTPNNQMRLWLKDYAEMMANFAKEGAPQLEQLRGAKVQIEAQLERALASGVDKKYIEELRALLAGMNAEIMKLEVRDLSPLAAQMQALKDRGGSDAQQQWTILAEKVKAFSAEAQAAVPNAKALADEIDRTNKEKGVYKKPDVGPEIAARAELEALVKEATRRDPGKRAAMLEGVKAVAGKDVIEQVATIKRERTQKDPDAYSTKAVSSGLVQNDKKTEELVKSGQEAARALKGFISADEITKVTATVSSLGGASKMSAEETLKVGESLSKAAAAGQKLAPELMAVVKNYGAVSAQQEVLAAKGGLAAQALKDQAALFTSVAAAGAIPTEMIMKYGEALYKTQQAGVTLQPVLAGVAAEWAKLSSADKAFMAAGGMSADAMQKQEAELQKLAEAGKLTNAVIKEQGPAAVAAAAAGQTLGEKQQFVADSFRKTSAEMAAMSAQGFLAEDELKKLATNFLELGDKIPIELLNQSGEALWKMAVAGKLAKENLPGMTPEAIAALQTQAEAWATNSLKETAGVGPTAGPNKAVKDLQDKIKLQQGQAGGLYGMGTEALGGLLKSVQSAAAGATGDYALVGQQLMADIMEGMRKTGEKGLQGQTPEALRALAEGFKATGEQQKALGTAEGLKAADAAAKNLTVTMAEMHNQGLLTADEIARIDANETKAAESAVKWGGILSGIVGLAGMLGGKFEGVAQVVGNIGDSWARIGSMPSPAKALAEFQKANASINAQSKNVLGTKLTGQEMFDKVEKDAKRAKLMAKIGAGAQVLGQVGGMLDKGTGNQQVAAKTMQGAAAGAQMGMIAGPIGAGVGAVIGGVLGFLKGSKLKKDAKAAGKALGMEVSQELAKQIQDTAKDLKIDIKSAALLNLSSAMAESKKAAGTFAPQVASLMKGIADGSIPAAQGLEQVGEAFTKIADEAMKAGTVGSREMVALIKQARAMKIDSPEIKAFVGEQLNLALAGVKKFVSAIKVLDEEWVKWLKDSRGDALGEEGMKKAEDGIKSLGKTAGVVFGAMFSALAEENGIVSAVDAMSEDFASLKESLSASLGPEMASQILGPFAAAFDTIGNEHLRPLFEGIDGLSQAMKGLANAGYLNTEQFAAMQAGIGTMFDLSIAGGADMKTSLLAVSPAIQAAISAAQEFGIPLDADTQRLKTLAEQNGITFKTDPMRAMLDVMVEIAKVMGATIPDSVKKMQGSFQDAAGAVTGAMIDPVALGDQLALVSEEIGGFAGDTRAAAAAAAGIALLETQTAAVAIGTTTMDQIAAMATSAAAGNAAAGDSLAAALGVGAVAVGDLANDPGWADLVLALGSDVPEAAAAAAAAIAAIIANVPGAVTIPVNVVTNGGPPPPDVPPVTPPEFAGGSQGWRSFSSKGTPVLLHNTEAVIRPGDPVLPGQVGGGNTTTVHLNINENPMQTAQTVEQMRRFTLRAAERELSKNLSGRIEAGKA